MLFLAHGEPMPKTHDGFQKKKEKKERARLQRRRALLDKGDTDFQKLASEPQQQGWTRSTRVVGAQAEHDPARTRDYRALAPVANGLMTPKLNLFFRPQ